MATPDARTITMYHGIRWRQGLPTVDHPLQIVTLSSMAVAENPAIEPGTSLYKLHHGRGKEHPSGQLAG